MLRVSERTRRDIAQIGREDFGGATAEETVRRLVEEHWQAKAIAAVQRYRESDPDGWRAYVAEADRLSAADAPITDEWAGGRA